jgi:hypothetical protein
VLPSRPSGETNANADSEARGATGTVVGRCPVCGAEVPPNGRRVPTGRTSRRRTNRLPTGAALAGRRRICGARCGRPAPNPGGTMSRCRRCLQSVTRDISWEESDRDNRSRAASQRANGSGGRHRSFADLWTRRGDKSSQPAGCGTVCSADVPDHGLLSHGSGATTAAGRGLTSVIMVPAWVHGSRPGIGSASAARQGGAWKGSAKYWVSCVTRSPVNSMTLTA